MKKILWVKFGWSDYYRGEPVDGNFGWLKNKQNDGARGPGHEAFNFNPGPDGTFYCYVPPQTKFYAPSNKEPDGWTVVCLAKRPEQTGIHIVGWYENATLHGDWLPLPGSINANRGDSGSQGYDWSYCISSKTAYIVPPDQRNMPFSNPSIRMGKYSFLSGPNVQTTENKERVLTLIEDRISELKKKKLAVKNPDEGSLPDPELDEVDPFTGFGSAEQRKKVEQAAERVVIKFYEGKGYSSRRVTHLPCGYDFSFVKGQSELHVEVKGTASPLPRFFLTRNEHKMGLQSNPAWRLAMVTSALAGTPSIKIYDAAELRREFDLEPYVYMGRIAPALVK